MEIEVNQSAWNVQYGESRDRKVTLQVADNIPQSLRVGDEFTLTLVLSQNALEGDSISVKIRVTDID